MEQNNEKLEVQVVNRGKVIIRTSIIGILTNVFLAAFKAVIGIVSNSIAVTLDAVNNLSDALSSIITIVGTKLAGKLPDKKHPLGYGRIEYLSAMIISVLVLYAGFTAFTESVKKIIHPETPEYTAVSLIIVAVAVVVKILLGRYVKHVGEKVNSDSLVNSGEISARFMIDHLTGTLLEVPAKQMEDFIRVINEMPEAIYTNSFTFAKGDHVRVTGGPLKGVEGDVVETEDGTFLTVRVLSLLCALVKIPRGLVVPSHE